MDNVSHCFLLHKLQYYHLCTKANSSVDFLISQGLYSKVGSYTVLTVVNVISDNDCLLQVARTDQLILQQEAWMLKVSL